MSVRHQQHDDDDLLNVDDTHAINRDKDNNDDNDDDDENNILTDDEPRIVLSPEQQMLQAVVLMEDALAQRKPEHLMDPASIRFYRWYNSRLVKWVLRLTVLGNLALALIEAPTAVWSVPIVWSTSLELLCLTIFALQAWAKYRFLRRGRLMSDKKNVVHLVVIGLQSFDIALYIALRNFGLPAIRWSRALRCWYIAYSNKSIRLALRDIRKTVRDIADVLLLVLLLVCFYTLICTVLFAESGDESFANLGISFVSLYALLTTVNYPGVMMPSYNQSKWWSLLFISYLILGVFILMNLVLAVVYNNYRKHFKADIKKIIVRRNMLMSLVFDLLEPLERARTGRTVAPAASSSPRLSASGASELLNVEDITQPSLQQQQQQQQQQQPSPAPAEEPSIGFHLWCEFMKRVKPSWSQQRVSLLFDLLDGDDDRRVTAVDFLRVPTLLETTFHRSDSHVDNVFSRTMPRLYGSRAVARFRAFVMSRYFGWLVDVVIVINCILIVVDFYLNHFNQLDRSSVLAIEIAFTTVFALEALSKVFVMGPTGYWSDMWHRFDLFIVVASAVDITVALAIHQPSSLQMSRFLLLGRVARLLRLVYKLKRFRVVLRSISILSPVVMTYGVVMFVLYYAFAMVGMDLWGGAITPDAEALRGSAFAADNYFANNFNSLPESLVLLFVLTVQNDWLVLASGFVLVSTPFAYIYFIVFNVVSTIMILNIIVAFILEVFQLQVDIEKYAKEDPLQRRLDVLSERNRLVGRWQSSALQGGYTVIQSVFRDEIARELLDEFDQTGTTRRRAGTDAAQRMLVP
jgi:hypothetical protein